MNLESVFTAEFWRQFVESEFNLGFATAIVMVVVIWLVLFVLGIIWRVVRRRKRCGSVEMVSNGGTVTIARDAVEKAARQELERVPELDIHRVQLYRQGKNYSLLLCCFYEAGARGLPEVVETVRPKVIDALRRLFGITTLDRVNFRIEELRGSDNAVTSDSRGRRPAVKAIAVAPEVDREEEGESC